MQDLASGENCGPSAADALWSVVVGAAAQASVEQGANIDIVDVLPDNFDEQYLPASRTFASAAERKAERTTERTTEKTTGQLK